jgi:2-iminobutanoate/2-iminopropanoate deaminase
MSLVTRFSTDKLPKPIAPYSVASIIDMGSFYMIQTSGLIGINEKQEIISDCVEEQTDLCLKYYKIIVDENKGNIEDTVKVNIYVIDLNDFSTVNQVYSKYFTSNYPSRTCVQVSRLPKDAKVEIEATFVVKK